MIVGARTCEVIMAKTPCVLLCVFVILQSVNGQFGFFQREPQNNRNFFGQGFFQAPNRIREGIQGFFNPNRQRPGIINQQPPPNNVYVIESGVPITALNPGQTVVLVEEQNGGAVNFQPPPENEGFRPNQGNEGFQINQGNEGGPNQETAGYQPNPVNMGYQPDQGNEGFRPDQGNAGINPNQGNEGFVPNNGNVNFGNKEQNQPGESNQANGGFQSNDQENRRQEDNGAAPENDPVKFDDTPKVPETTPLPVLTPVPETTPLPALTPVPTVQTDSRNSFNFDSSPVFGESCETIDGGLGSCISIYNCQPYLKLIQEARNQAMQVLRKAHCGFEGNNPKVCCPRPGFSTVPPSEPSTTTTTTTTVAPSPSPVPSTKTVGGDFIAALPGPPECGLSNATLSRVVGGVDAKLNDFPWMSLLGYKDRRRGTSWLCGGSLISPHHVLTACHCIHNHEDDLYLVRLGELDLTKEDDGANPIDIPIKEKIKHEQYSPTAFTNDIGILVLERDVQYSDSIKPICIPMDSELRARSFEDYNPLIAGWGHTEFRGPAASHLQVLQLPVVSNDFCSQAYSQYKSQKIDQRVLCAGFKKGGKDACQGDSGGPLMQPIWSKSTYQTYFYQIGVVSYGKKCAEAGFPGVYSRVTYFVPWIEEKVLGHTKR